MTLENKVNSDFDLFKFVKVCFVWVPSKVGVLQKKFGPRKIWVPKNFGFPKNLGPERIWVLKNFGPQPIWVPKIICKNFKFQKKFCPKKNFGDKKYRSQKF